MAFDFFDKNGKGITLEEWGKLRESFDYCRIGHTYVWWRNLRISTIWLGMNHAWDGQEIKIFETMVFKGRNSYDDIACVRYTTEAEAIAGHEAIVRKVRWGKRVGYHTL